MNLRQTGIILANGLTLLRVVLALLFYFQDDHIKLIFVIAATLSEFLDGQIARRFNAETTFGRLMDPIADKLFILAVFISLIVDNHISFFQLALLASRDLLIIYAMLYGMLTQKWPRIRNLHPRWTGKVATFMQFVFVLNVYLRWLPQEALIIATALASLLAAIDYYWLYRNQKV